MVLQEYVGNDYNSRIADLDKSEIIDAHIIADGCSFEVTLRKCCYMFYMDYFGKEIADSIIYLEK